MNPDPAEPLQALLREVPYVRALARALCADGRGDADEVVQQSWLQALQHGPAGVTAPRSWLGRIVRNVASNLRRAERRRRERERDVVRDAAVPSSDEWMLREERRRDLVQRIDALPERQRAVLLLRYFEGLPPRQIAARLELPVATVWNLHGRALRNLRRDLDAAAQAHGQADRRAWLLPLAGVHATDAFGTAVAGSTAKVATAAGSSALALGALTMTMMTMKTKLAAACVALLAVCLYAVWGLDPAPVPVPPVAAAGDVPTDALVVGKPAAGVDAAGRVSLDGEVGRSAALADPHGALRVRVVHAGADAEPAAGVTVHLRLPYQDLRSARRSRSDAAGVVIFADVAPGRVLLQGDRFDPSRRVEVTAGQTTEHVLVLPQGMDLRGRVVDAVGRGIAGASIDVVMTGLVGLDPETLATTDAAGRFAVRGVPPLCGVCARAAGYVASPLRQVEAADGRTGEIEITLDEGGGSIDVAVFGPDGHPLEGALVCAGAGDVQGLMPGLGRIVTLPALGRTDAAGRCVVVGLAPGEQPVWARAPGGALGKALGSTPGLAPWRGTCVVAAHGSTPLRIDLRSGAALRGVVTAADGTPVAGAELTIGDWGEADRARAWSHSDGGYLLRGLAPGETVLSADEDTAGRARVTVRLQAGVEHQVDVRLSRGLELRGRITAGGAAAVGAGVGAVAGDALGAIYVQATAPRTRTLEPWGKGVFAAQDGTFAVDNCPAGRRLTVTFRGKGIADQVVREVDPAAGELVVRVVRRQPPSVRIRGTVCAPDGSPLAGVRVRPIAGAGPVAVAEVVTGADGVFAIEPLHPGTWRLSIERPGYPAPHVEARTLGEGAQWDLGTIRLEAGGTAEFRSASPAVDAKALHCMVSDDKGRRWVLSRDGEFPRTPLLADGPYRLQVWGRGCAARVVPFTIVAGQRTAVEIAAVPCVRQRLELAVPDAVAVGPGATLRVTAGDETLVDWWLPVPVGAPWTCELWLKPGTYRVTAAGRLRGTAELRIGTTEAAAVRLEMRRPGR